MTDKKEILDFVLESKKIWDSFCDDLKAARSLRGFDSLPLRHLQLIKFHKRFEILFLQV